MLSAMYKDRVNHEKKDSFRNLTFQVPWLLSFSHRDHNTVLSITGK